MLKTYKELVAEYTDLEFIKRFKQLFELKMILSNSIPTNENAFSSASSLEIVLTKEGQVLFEKIISDYEVEDSDSLKLAIFLDFYHESLYINIYKTNIESIVRYIHDKVKSREILLPWIFDRLLYDKYFEEFESQATTLSEGEVLRLLDGTPQGVFQLGNFLTGPFGILQSESERYFQPTSEVKLWHCSDPSCPGFHEINFEKVDTELYSFLSLIEELNDESPYSGWGGYYHSITEKDEEYYDINNLREIFDVIANGFSESELRVILNDLLNTTNLRGKLKGDKKFSGSNDSMVTQLNKAECFQIILLLDDLTIIKSIEKLIATGNVKIPPTEIRLGNNTKPFGTHDIYHELNRLGLRAVSKSEELSSVMLKNLLLEIYDNPNMRSQLEWKLRNISEASSLNEKIDIYIHQEEPTKIINETILSGLIQLEKAIEFLPGYFEIPKTQEDERYLINKLLWKLGYNINIFPTSLERFWTNYEKFRRSITSSSKYNEIDKEEIRSSAVNFFVSLEEVLEQTLSFVTWTLLSDHYISTKFIYVFEEAREFMADQLNGFEFKTGESLLIDRTGKNPLFPLVEGFNALVKTCDSLINEGRENYLRPEVEIPSFNNNDKIRIFPFQSKKMVFDIKPDEYETIKDILVNIPKEFSKYNVLSVRNRLQHNRSDFPLQDEMLDTCNCVEKVISLIENKNIYPNVYLFKELKIDRFNRLSYKFENYKRCEIKFASSPELLGMGLPNTTESQVIFPNIKVGLTSHPLRFKYMESSDYQRFWRNYPRRKKIENQTL